LRWTPLRINYFDLARGKEKELTSSDQKKWSGSASSGQRAAVLLNRTGGKGEVPKKKTPQKKSGGVGEETKKGSDSGRHELLKGIHRRVQKSSVGSEAGALEP